MSAVRDGGGDGAEVASFRVMAAASGDEETGDPEVFGVLGDDFARVAVGDDGGGGEAVGGEDGGGVVEDGACRFGFVADGCGEDGGAGEGLPERGGDELGVDDGDAGEFGVSGPWASGDGLDGGGAGGGAVDADEDAVGGWGREGADDADRAGGFLDGLLGDAAEEESGDAGAVVGAGDDEVGFFVFGELDEAP